MSAVTEVDQQLVKLEPAANNADINQTPRDHDFDEDIPEEEREFYKSKYLDLNDVKHGKLHCTACDKHLGCAARNESRMRSHPMLRTLVCQKCHAFYNSGEFEKGDDGSELYCRWCGQGGQVYCCADCSHVFCAKCIRRNFGPSKIKEIESIDEWKCFKCAPKCLWEMRALCWALLRYCDLNNKLAYTTQDPELKEKYQKACSVDDSECCKDKKKKPSSNRKKENEEASTPSPASADIVSRISPAIQVKKFASINLDESPVRVENNKKKRSGSPIKNKASLTSSSNMFKNPLSIAPFANVRPYTPPAKKAKIQPVIMQPQIQYRMPDKRLPMGGFPRIPLIRQRISMPMPMQTVSFNGFSPLLHNDNINLSLESLTQGLDLAAVAAMTSARNDNDDVVCTPDFPMEAVLDEEEDNNDDDVQCMTPGPIVAPKPSAPMPPKNKLPDLSPENIIQMTENDVTVNAVTGGLKFRVDPQTLSSNKMYRLPDGRLIAINVNPNMPGGYSATVVAVSESGAPSKSQQTFSAKVSAITTKSTPPPLVARKTTKKVTKGSKSSTPRATRGSAATNKAKDKDKSGDEEGKPPTEWFRFNVIEAVDAVEYSLYRFQRLKKKTPTEFLRSRSVKEIVALHKNLDRLLNTSAARLNEIRNNLNRGLKKYVLKKGEVSEEDDDDDVEILSTECDDPIYIDENSGDESATNGADILEPEVDLLSDHNDTADKDDSVMKPVESISDISSEKLNDSSENDKLKEADKEEVVPLANSSKDEYNENKEESNEDKEAEEVESKEDKDECIEDKEEELKEDKQDDSKEDMEECQDHANIQSEGEDCFKNKEEADENASAGELKSKTNEENNELKSDINGDSQLMDVELNFTTYGQQSVEDK